MSDVITSFVFGFTLAISVGPIAMIVVLNGLKYGKVSAAKSALGAASGDFIFALLSFSIGGALITYLSHFKGVIEWVSAMVLIAFGLYTCFSAYREKGKVMTTNIEAKGFRTTLLLTIVNPLTIIAFVAFVGQLSNAVSIFQVLALAFALFAGSLLAQLLYALVSVKLRSKLNNPRIVLFLQLVSGLGVLGFGLKGVLITTIPKHGYTVY